MKIIALVLMAAACLSAQAPASRSVLGTVAAFRPETAEMEVKPETGTAVVVKVSSATPAKKVAPGQTDLAKAQDINITDVAVGDRVLVTIGPDGSEARRIIVIPANDLAKRDAADRQDWQKRGVAGVVTAVSGNDISVEMKSLGGATKYTVTAGPKTTYIRYAPDSVRFADAKKSSLAEISVGDQLRARGAKSPDGAKVDAEDIVFGTFLSKAGSITAVNAAAHEITIKDLSNNKPLVVRFNPESQIKRMPEGGAPGGGRGPAPGAAPAAAPKPAAAPAPGPSAAAGAPGPGRGPGAGGQRGPDIAQMIEALPPVKIEDLKAGEVVVISAIRSAKADQITAITFLANAEALVRLAAGPTGPAPSLQGLASSMGSVGP